MRKRRVVARELNGNRLEFREIRGKGVRKVGGEKRGMLQTGLKDVKKGDGGRGD